MNEQHEYDTMTEEEERIVQLAMWMAEGMARSESHKKERERESRLLREIVVPNE